MARVLVIEDTPGSLELMKYLLTASGHEVLAASDGAQGLDHAQRGHPDLILCDVHMPGMDGFEVARRLKDRADTASIRLVALTALAMAADRDRILASGFDGYLTKPIDPETLMAHLAELLPGANGGAPAPPIRIPAPAAPPPASPATAAPVATLLAVDNVGDNLELIRGIFEPAGYQVVTAGSVAEALLLLRRSTPDLILSDLHMPHEDGTALLAAVKADPALRRIPFIIISSSASGRSGEAKAMELGADRYILRPIEPHQLQREVRACLDARAGSPG